MFRFASPDYLLYGLPALAALAVAVWWRFGALSRKRVRLADAGLLADLTTGPPWPRRKWRYLLGLAALACWLVALANPQYGTRLRTAEVSTTEVVVALDISESMLTEDVRPSRLDRAQNFLLDFLDALDGERVALVLFAGQAYVQVPLTSDYGAVKLLVRAANPRQAATQGTNFGAAVTLSRRLLAPDAGEESAPVRRVVVLVSDGENHEPLAEDALREANATGLVLHAVGVGTPEGGLVPARGGLRNAYKRGPGGEPVRSLFDGEALRSLAEAGGGRYYDLNANAFGVAGAVARAVGEDGGGDGGEEVFAEAASYYQLALGAGFLLWLAAWLVGLRLYGAPAPQTISPEPRVGGA